MEQEELNGWGWGQSEYGTSEGLTHANEVLERLYEELQQQNLPKM